MALERSRMRRWCCRFLGDPDYGRDRWEDATPTVIEAVDASTAARKALARWRSADAEQVRLEGWYGDGTIVGVQEVVDPPPVRVFVKAGGRLKMERT
jgi:hypothetical protein